MSHHHSIGNLVCFLIDDTVYLHIFNLKHKIMKGENLKKAEQWFIRAVKMEEEEKFPMMNRCINKMVELEKTGLAAGESW